MRAVPINFSGNGALLNFKDSVIGFWPTVQNALVYIGQKADSDKIFPEKGTNLHNNAAAGGMVSPEIFEVALDQLASEIQNFTLDTDEDYNEHQLNNIDLELEIWDRDKARIKVSATSSTGEVIGATSEL